MILMNAIPTPGESAKGISAVTLVLLGILAFCIVLTVLLGASSATNSKFSPPQNFERVAAIDLSSRSYSA